MFFKLSLRNMKRSFSDYGIYFVTLMLAVCLFYIFNSISAQQVMLNLSNAQVEMLTYLDNIMGLASILVSLIFCILCLFANQFLIKRRKKEFGLYISMGMSRFQVSKLLIFESLLVGACSLAVGIGVGALLSQGMSLFNAALFDTQIVNYSFIFSWDAALKTIVFFGLVFFLVMLFNVFTVSKYELITLLQANQKSEQEPIKNSKFQALMSAVSLVTLLYGYRTLLHTDLSRGFQDIVLGSTLLLLGTVLFYFFAVNFVLYCIQKNKKMYYHQLNLFNVRQLKSKINTAVVAMISISCMLFFTIAVLSNAMSYKNTIEKELGIVAPFDASIAILTFEDPIQLDYDVILPKLEVDFEQNDYAIVDIYSSDINAYDLLYPYAEGLIKKDLANGMYFAPSVIAYSDYLELMKLQGIKPIELQDDETLILTNMNEAHQTLKNMVADKKTYEVGEETLTLAAEGYQVAAIETENIGRLLACFVVPDRVVETLTHSKAIINLQYRNEGAKADAFLTEYFETLDSEGIIENYHYYSIRGITKSLVYDETVGYTINFLYAGIYLGIVFLIASGAVLGLRLLSDASEEQERYVMLKRLGTSEQQIQRSIRNQVLAYFAIPLVLAIPNAWVAGATLTKQMSSTAYTFSIAPALVTIVVLLLLYGGYFIITYNSYKKIVTK